MYFVISNNLLYTKICVMDGDFMLKLSQSELYNSNLSAHAKTESDNAIRAKLSQGISLITPDKIEIEVSQLKMQQKRSWLPLISDALSLYEAPVGRVKLFNLADGYGTKSAFASWIPFTVGMMRDRTNEMSSARKAVPTIFVNMYKIGQWSADGSSYRDLSAATDLYTCLETGDIAYKMLIEEKADEVLGDTNVLEYLTKIYSTLFLQTIINVRSSISDSQADAARFIIAKFFLKYCVQIQSEDRINDIALKTVKSKSSIPFLLSYEQNAMIDYNSLSGFLKTFGLSFFQIEIGLNEFITKWISMNGEGLLLAVEYIPYFIHFLFAVKHNALLGGSSKLYRKQNILEQEGLSKLYTAIISKIR